MLGRGSRATTRGPTHTFQEGCVKATHEIVDFMIPSLVHARTTIVSRPCRTELPHAIVRVSSSDQ